MKIADVQDASAYEYHIGKITGSRQFTVETIDNNGITVGSDPITVYIDEEELVQIEYPDSDSDGVADIFEHIYATDPEKYDTDSDGLNDYEEIYLFGTDPLAADSDNDNLPDGFEIYQTGTDPLIKDSIGEGKTDDVYDMDNDGLTNYQEYKYGTNPLNDDTDGDGLDDHSEIFTHKTDPLLVDTDSDNVCDGDEIALGLDPNAPQTHGCPDSKYTLVQKLDYNSEKLSEINDSANNPFDISVEMDCAGLIENNLKAYESGYTAAIENESIVGIVPEISYPEDLEIKSFKLTFKLDSSAAVNTNDCHNEEDTEFEGIERFTVFKMFEDYNMLLPVETYYKSDSNEVYVKTDAAGTYCLVDTELWVDMLEKQMDSYTGYYDSEGELSEDLMEENVSGKLTDEVSVSSDNLSISSMYSAGDTNKKTIVFICEDVEDEDTKKYISGLKKLVSKYQKGNEVNYSNNIDGKNYMTTDGTFIVTDSIQKNLNYLISEKNVFCFIIFDGNNAKYDKKAGYTLINKLVSNNIDVSLVSNPSKIENYDFGMTLTKETGGIVINTNDNYNNDDSVAQKMYKHVFGDSDGGEYGIILIDPCNYKKIKLKNKITEKYLENAKTSFFDLDRSATVTNAEYTDSDNDNLYDFEEIRFFWDEDKNEQTITWDNNEAVFPKIPEVCKKLNEKYGFIDEKYVTDLKTKYSIDDSTRILPIWSDPTSEDGDLDGITDYNERVAIEEYKKYEQNKEQYQKKDPKADIREYYACTLDPVKKDTVQTIVEGEKEYLNLSIPNSQAVIVKIVDNKITIYANVNYKYYYLDENKTMKIETSDTKEKKEENPNYQTVISSIHNGIINAWSTEFVGTSFDFYPGLNVSCNVTLNDEMNPRFSNGFNNGYVTINFFEVCGRSHSSFQGNPLSLFDNLPQMYLYGYSVSGKNGKSGSRCMDGFKIKQQCINGGVCTDHVEKKLSERERMNEAAHEFGHILGLTDSYLNAKTSKVNGFYYQPYKLVEVPENEIMTLSDKKSINYTANANDIEMVLMASIEKRPQSFIHQLGEIIYDDPNKTPTKYVLSKAIRTPTVVLKRCKIDGDGKIINTSYWAIDEISLKPYICIEKKQNSDSVSESEINSWIIDKNLEEYYDISEGEIQT